jgi:hypothetical protein
VRRRPRPALCAACSRSRPRGGMALTPRRCRRRHAQLAVLHRQHPLHGRLHHLAVGCGGGLPRLYQRQQACRAVSRAVHGRRGDVQRGRAPCRLHGGRAFRAGRPRLRSPSAALGCVRGPAPVSFVGPFERSPEDGGTSARLCSRVRSAERALLSKGAAGGTAPHRSSRRCRRTQAQ